MFVFAAFVTVLGRTPDAVPGAVTFAGRKAIFVLGVTAIFWAASVRILANNLPEEIVRPLYNMASMHDKVRKLDQKVLDRAGNQRVLEVVRGIPKANSLVFLTNSAIGGIIADRSDIWPFPHYYDAADYLVMQPGVRQSWFSFSTSDSQNFKESLAKGRSTIASEAVIHAESVKATVRHLVVDEKTHRLVVDEPGVVLLERLRKRSLYAPSSTVGFGWIHNIGLRRNENADQGSSK